MTCCPFVLPRAGSSRLYGPHRAGSVPLGGDADALAKRFGGAATAVPAHRSPCSGDGEIRLAEQPSHHLDPQHGQVGQRGLAIGLDKDPRELLRRQMHLFSQQAQRPPSRNGVAQQISGLDRLQDATGGTGDSAVASGAFGSAGSATYGQG